MGGGEKGFAVIVALLVVAIMSAAAAASFFISVSDMKMSFNRLQAKKALRDAERVLAEAEMSVERCLETGALAECAAAVGDEVRGAGNAVSESDSEFSLTAAGRAGNFSAEIEASYSAHNGTLRLESWHRRVEGSGE